MNYELRLKTHNFRALTFYILLRRRLVPNSFCKDNHRGPTSLSKLGVLFVRKNEINKFNIISLEYQARSLYGPNLYKFAMQVLRVCP